MNDFIKLGDIVLITGSMCTGKTTFAKCISENIKQNNKQNNNNIKSIYINWIKITSFELEEIYNNNKDNETIIIIDLYIELRNRMRFSNLFKQRKNFTIIFIMNHLSYQMIKFADILFFAKTVIPYRISAIHNKLNQIHISTNKNTIMNKMNKLNNKGFLYVNKYINKFDKKMNKEYYIKDITIF